MLNPSSDSTRFSGCTRVLRRLRPQFRLQTVLVIVLLIGFGLSIVVVPAERQRHAVSAIKMAGGVVWYDFQINENHGRGDYNATLPGPAWVRAIMGIDYFANPKQVYFYSEEDSTADAFRALGVLHRLTGISVDRVQISAAEIRNLTELVDLRTLELYKCSLLDDGWREIGTLSQVRQLYLCDCNLGDVAMSWIGRLPNLCELTLQDAHISDTGLMQLRVNQNLRRVTLSRCENISAAAVRRLQHDIPALSVSFL